MPNARQTKRTLRPRADTAFLAISLRRDGLTTFLRAPAQRQTLVVPLVAFDVAQVVATKAKPPVFLVIGQANKPVSDLRIFVRQYRLVTVAGLADAKCQTDQTDA